MLVAHMRPDRRSESQCMCARIRGGTLLIFSRPLIFPVISEYGMNWESILGGYFHPCRVRFVLPAPMRTPPPRTAGLMRSSNANSLTLVSRRSPLGHMVLLGRPPTASSKPPLLTPLAQCLALGCGQAPSNTLTYYSVLLSLEQTLAC